jgi:hypothetical protein
MIRSPLKEAEVRLEGNVRREGEGRVERHAQLWAPQCNSCQAGSKMQSLQPLQPLGAPQHMLSDVRVMHACRKLLCF